MPKTDPRVDAYIAKSADFAKPILTHLRALVHQTCPQAEETVKWGMPFFTHHGLLCMMSAFKAHCGLGFWRGGEIFGENRTEDGEKKDAMGHFGKITCLADLPTDAALISYIKKAVALNEAGPKKASPARPTVKKTFPVPDYFLAALRKNKKALANFAAFPPSHKREYVEWVIEAKREETRQKRLAAAVERIAQAQSRYAEYRGC